MKKMFIRSGVFAILLLAVPVRGIGTTFLNVPFTPRQLVIGSAALLGDPSLFRLNPALVVQDHAATQVYFGYNGWLADAAGHSVMAVQPLMGGTIAVGLRSLSIDGLELRTSRPTDEPVANFISSGTAVEAGWGKRSGFLQWGGTVRWLRMESYVYASSGLAFDAGTTASLMHGRLSIGAALRNVGSMNTFREAAPTLPTSVSGGIVFRPLQVASYMGLLTSASADFSERNGTIVRFSAEASVGDLSVSAGMSTAEEVSSVSAGVEFRARILTISYSFELASHNLGMPHLIQIQFTLP
ncbi:MAG: hypothetical protein VX822_03690 [Candidatus Neomarinimicrobiota bacterium]|nr:hypothetical protein [Candidatus Neomarinimicrobiota bacterium]